MALTFADPVHPGEYLREEYLIPLGLSAGALAKALHLPRTRIERIVKEEVGVSADTALRLSRYFGTSPDIWLNFQRAWDLHKEAEALKDELERIVPRSIAD